MPTSSAPEPLPSGTQPLKAVPEPLSFRPDSPFASGQRPATAPPDRVRHGARAAGRAQPMMLLQGGQEERASETRDDESPEPSPKELASARQAARRRLPPPAEVAKDIAIALFEVEAGYRSAAQLERVCTPELWDRLERQVRRNGEPLPSGRKLIRVHYQELMPGVANTVAVVERGPRVQPVAMRLDARSGRWLVTELRY